MIGIDIESVIRIKSLLERKPDILNRFFSSYELDYAQQKANPAQSLTGIWCAKEAIVKAFSSFNEVIFITDIEIHHNVSSNAPYVFHITNQNLLKQYNIDVSISHTSEYATAIAIIRLKQ